MRQPDGISAAVISPRRLANEPASIARETAEAFGEIPVLVNNAGVIAWKPLGEQEDDEVRRLARERPSIQPDRAVPRLSRAWTSPAHLR